MKIIIRFLQVLIFILSFIVVHGSWKTSAKPFRYQVVRWIGNSVVLTSPSVGKSNIQFEILPLGGDSLKGFGYLLFFYP